MEKTAIFFHAYQKAGATGVIPLSEPELKYLPHMIRAANIYIMNWVIQDFYNTENVIDPCNHIKYLKHYSLVLQWLEKSSNFNELEELFYTPTNRLS